MNNYEKIERAKGLIDLINEYDSDRLDKSEREEILEKINKIYGFDLFAGSGYMDIMEYFSDIYYSFPSYDEKKSFINWMNYFNEDVICNITRDVYGDEHLINNSSNNPDETEFEFRQSWRCSKKIDSTMAKISEDFSKLTDQYVDEKTKISNNEYVMDEDGNLVSKQTLLQKGNRALIYESMRLEEQKELYNNLAEKYKLKSELNELCQNYLFIKNRKTLTALEDLYLSRIKEIEKKISNRDYGKDKAENENKNEIISLCNKTVNDYRTHFGQVNDKQVNEKMENYYSRLLEQDEFALESLNEELTQKDSNSNEKNNDEESKDKSIDKEKNPDYLKLLAAQKHSERHLKLKEVEHNINSSKKKMLKSSILAGVGVVGLIVSSSLLNHGVNIGFSQAIQHTIDMLSSISEFKNELLSTSTAEWISIGISAFSLSNYIKGRREYSEAQQKYTDMVNTNPMNYSDPVEYMGRKI